MNERWNAILIQTKLRKRKNPTSCSRRGELKTKECVRERQEHESTKLSKKKEEKEGQEKRRQKPRFLEPNGSCHMTE